MSTDPLPAREPFGRSILRALLFAVIAGAAVGALEAAKLILQDNVRYARWAIGTFALSVGGYALAAIPLALLSVLAARVVWGRPTFRAAPPSACAGLGTALALLVYLVTDRLGLALLPIAAIGFTLACVLFRELLAWWREPTRLRVPLVVLVACTAAAGAHTWLRDSGGGPPAPYQGPNVVVLSIDTLRADRLGCYGSAVVHTPRLDGLAGEGVVFEQAIAQSNITGPSHTTLLSGLSPAEHGVLSNGQRIPNRAHTVAETLGRAGLDSAGFVSGFTLKDEACGFAARFGWYDDELIEWQWMPEACARLRLVKDVIRWLNTHGHRPLRADRPADETVTAALDWLERTDPRRFFLFVHFYDPHCPYEPPGEFARMYDPGWKGDPYVDWYMLSTAERRELVASADGVSHQIALYHGEIGYADEQAGRLFDYLKSRGLWDDTLVIATSDHGEELGEHGIWFDHGSTLYDTELHVPLIVKLPRGDKAGARVAQQVRLADVAPTILDVTGAAADYAPTGASLLPLIAATAASERPATAFNDLPGIVSDYEMDGRGIALRERGLKLIWTSEVWLDSQRVPERWELYELATDPRETRDLYGPAASPPPIPAAVGELRQRLEALIQATANLAAESEVSDEVRSQLRLLGYGN